MKESYHSRWYR